MTDTKLFYLAVSLALRYVLPVVFPTIKDLSPILLFTIPAALLLSGQFIYNVIIFPNFLTPLRRLPGPKSTSLFLGETLSILSLPNGEPHRTWLQIPNSGLIRYLGLWNVERIFPTTPEALREILSTKAHIFVKPPTFEVLASVLGRRGLFFAEGEEHKFYRRMLMPSFGPRHLKELVPVFWEKAVELALVIAKPRTGESTTDQEGTEEKGWKTIDVTHYVSLATLDIIGAAGFAYDFGSLKIDGEVNQLARAYNSIFHGAGGRNLFEIILREFLPFKVVYNLPFGRSVVIRQASKTIKDESRRLVRERKAEMASGKKDGNDILSTMLASGAFDSPDGEDIAGDQIMTFLLAGHETTATSISWAIHALIKFPDLQKLLRKEVRERFPDGMPLTIIAAELEKLPYLKDFCAEVMRYWPPVALTTRIARESTTVMGQVVPAGTYAVIVPWALHREKSVWGEDADAFRPSRWPEREAKLRGADGDTVGGSNFDLLTFIAGPRSCIGERFSILEFRAVMAVLIGRFEWAPIGDLENDGFTGMGSENPEIKGGVTSKVRDARVNVREVEGW